MRLLLPLSLGLTMACGPKTRPKAAAAPIPPFSASQIQAAFQPGLQLTFRLVETGRPPVTSEWDVRSVTSETVTIRFTMRNADELVLGDPTDKTQTWAELEEHATFPVEATTWTDESVTVPAGTFPRARTYVVSRVEDGKPLEDHYTFALSLPGPPVRLVTKRFDEELLLMELVERRQP
jgi:hypothetical protein